MEPFTFVPVAPPAISNRVEDVFDLQPPATPMPTSQIETFADVLPVLPPLHDDFILSDDEEMDTDMPSSSISTSNVKMVPPNTSSHPSSNQKRKIEWQGFKIPKKPRLTSKYFPNKREHSSKPVTVIPPQGKTAGIAERPILKPTLPIRLPSTHKVDTPKKQLLQPILLSDTTIPSKESSSVKPETVYVVHPELKLFVNESTSAIEISPSYAIQRNDGCQVIRHTKVAVALCVLGNGFTITDGISAITRDLSSNSAIIAKKLAYFAPSVVILVGERTKRIWNDIQTSYEKEFAGVQKREFTTKYSVGKCTYCDKEQCHRWKAVVGGIGRWKRVKVPPIKH